MNLTQRETFTAGEVAALFGVGQSTVYRAAAAGDLSTFRVGGRVLFPRREILALLRLVESEDSEADQPTPDPSRPQVAA